MFYNVLPALGPAGWALGGAALGVALVKAFADDCDRTVTVSPPSNAKRRKRKHAKERAAFDRVAERLSVTLAKFESRLDVMQSQINDLAKREPRHPEPGDT